MIYRFLLCFLLFSAVSPFAFSEGSDGEESSVFKIETYLPESKDIKWHFGSGYMSGNSDTINIIPGTVSVHGHPAIRSNVISTRSSNYEKLYANAGINYGLTSDLSLSLKILGSYNEVSEKNNGNIERNNDIVFDKASLGINYEFNEPYEVPFMVGYISTDFYTENNKLNSFGKIVSLGVSSHWAYEPIMFSVAGGYTNYSDVVDDKFDRNRHNNKNQVASLSGNVDFAVNPEITLSWGVSGAYDIDKDSSADSSKAAFSLNLGTSIIWSPDYVVSFSYQGGVGDNKFNSLSVTVFHR